MRRSNDFYPTDEALVKRLLENVDIRGVVLEPCAGDGRMAAALRATTGRAVVTCDVDPAHYPDHVLDMTRVENWRRFSPDWVVTNPPFSAAPQILPLAMERARVGVAFLLRLTYLEPAGNRADWLQDQADHMTRLIVFGQPRPAFRQGEINPKTGKLYTTDNATTAWMVWQPDHSWRALGVRPPFQFVTHWQGVGHGE